MPVPFVNDMLEELLALRAALRGLGVSAQHFAPDDGLCFMDCYLNKDGSHHPPCAAARAALANAEGR